MTSIIRKLGSRENYFAEFHQEYLHATLVYYFLVNSKDVIDQDQTKEALRRLQQRHQVLRLTITSLQESMYMSRYFMDVPNKEVTFCFVTSHDRRRAMENEQRKRFEEGDLLWRVHQMQSEKITDGYSYPFLFTFHHSAVDGRSVISLIETFLKILDDTLSNRPIDEKRRVEMLPLPPPVELIQFRCAVEEQKTGPVTQGANSDTRQAQPIASHTKNHTVEASGKLDSDDVGSSIKLNGEQTSSNKSDEMILKQFCDSCRTACPEPVTGLVDVSFSADETERMIQACKTHGVKVTGYFTAVAAEALVRLLSNKGIEVGSFETDVRCAVDLRPYGIGLVTDDDKIGIGLMHNACVPKVHIDHSMLHVDDGSKSFWRLAKSYHEELHQMLKQGKQFEGVRMGLRDALQERSHILKQHEMFSLKPHAKAFFAVSNQGHHDIKVDAKDSSIVALDDVYFISSFTFKHTALFGHKMLTVNEKCFWSLTYSKMLVDEDLAEEYGVLIKQVANTRAQSSDG
jgi:hypothetical protein